MQYRAPVFRYPAMKIRLRSNALASVPRFLVAIHRATLLAGGCLLAWPIFVTFDSAYAQWSGERQLARAEKAPQETIVSPKPKAARDAAQPKGSLLGKFELPRLRLSYVLLEGTDNRTLDKSVGHVEGTSVVGESGNIGIAGHRNTHFRKLEWVRRGDQILLSKGGKEYSYRVEWIRLFQPDDMQVLDAEHGPAVTLVTCFPFEYVGSAPLRMIVRALPEDETRARLLPQPKTVPATPAD